MKLCEQLQNNEQVAAILSKMAQTSKKQVGDVVLALNKLVETSPRVQIIEERISKAHVMCICMEPLAEDVIAMLLHVAHSNLRAPLKCFEAWFYKGKAQKYYQGMLDAFHDVSSDARTEKQKAARTAKIDYNIMKRVCHRMYENLIRTVKGRGFKDTAHILTAYKLVQEAYADALGEECELHLAYLISVALILAQEGMETAIVATALMHDLNKRTKCTFADIDQKCNPLLASHVEATTKLHQSFEAIHHRTQDSNHPTYLDTVGLEDLVTAIKGDQKLLSALYIKAAERIHELRLLNRLPQNGSLSNATGLDYLPLLKKLHINYFAGVIEDLEWRASNPSYYRAITERYEELLKQNSSYITSTYKDLCDCYVHNTEGVCSAYGMNVHDFDVNVFEYRYLSLEVHNMAKESVGLVNPESINEGSVPLCDFDIVVEPAEKVGDFMSLFVKSCSGRYNLTRRTIVDYTVDAYGRYIFIMQDAQRCTFRFCISSQANCDLCRKGYRQPTLPVQSAKEPPSGAAAMIDVYLRNGKRISLPVGACVLDAAFAIHAEVGLATRGATVNEHPANLYDKLRDGDHVIIDAETYYKDDFSKSYVPHVTVNWVIFVVTDKARRAIAKWCHENYEVKRHSEEIEVPDAVADSAMDASIKTLKGIWDFEQLE